MMKNISKVSFAFALAAVFSFNASAALFDTMESVDTLQKVADSKRTNTDRMPAGKVTDAPAADAPKTEESAPTKSATDSP